MMIGSPDSRWSPTACTASIFEATDRSDVIGDIGHRFDGRIQYGIDEFSIWLCAGRPPTNVTIEASLLVTVNTPCRLGSGPR